MQKEELKYRRRGVRDLITGEWGQLGERSQRKLGNGKQVGRRAEWQTKRGPKNI